MKINGTNRRQLHTSEGLLAWEWETKSGVQREIQLDNHKIREKVKIIYTEDKVTVTKENVHYRLELDRHVIPSQFTISSEGEAYTIRKEKDRLIILHENKMVGTFEWTTTFRSLEAVFGTRQRIFSLNEEISFVGLVASIIAIDEWLDYYTML
ncbi:hypothetical protein [Mangrovibacillus cuniculi]|uniref:Uncharacterized protein n=1 Tax=Mangrovibacillus cuniculi TaxID=2593652 RepID=A0A7S8CB70_9BACI|nr:hypothetical protein [Mangrovibacillus cuniculi]QPC46588.1 hypothetical protein G8O30_06220 [Mangrovibacillus cuniculi]